MITSIASLTIPSVTAQADVLIDGRRIDPYSISVTQRHDTHHHFEIRISTEKIEGKSTDIKIDQSINYAGKIAEILVQQNNRQLKFIGLITGVHIDRTYTGDNHIVLNGYSPTYMMEDGEATQSYTGKSLADIAAQITAQYPSNILKPSINPNYHAPIPYVVQYKETNFAFLTRLAARYGEWFCYDGDHLHFGQLPQPSNCELILGRDLQAFDYGINIRPSKFKQQFYNYEENRLVEDNSAQFKPSWLDNYGKKALDAADNIFPNAPLSPTWQDAPNDALLKHFVQTQKSAVLSNTSFFKGNTTNPNLRVGSKITVKAANQVNGQIVTDLVGNFRVINVTHYLDANKGYRNEFEAIPITVLVPPTNKNVQKPDAESQVAVVIDNNDPEKLGRVKAKFTWQQQGETTPWVRFVTGTAGGKRGLYFLPEIGDEVYVDFEQGNPDRPYVQGTFHNGNTSPEYFDANNNLKSIKTRAGHTLLFNDKNGEENITISDKSGNIIVLDAVTGSITISAPENMTLDCKNMFINVKENMQTQVGGSRLTVINEDSSESVGGNKSVIVESKISIASKSDASIASGTQAILSGSDSAVITAEKVAALAKKSLIAQSANGTAVLMGKKGVAVDSSQGVASLTGKNQVNIEAKGGATIIKGEPIKLN